MARRNRVRHDPRGAGKRGGKERWKRFEADLSAIPSCLIDLLNADIVDDTKKLLGDLFEWEPNVIRAAAPNRPTASILRDGPHYADYVVPPSALPAARRLARTLAGGFPGVNFRLPAKGQETLPAVPLHVAAAVLRAIVTLGDAGANIHGAIAVMGRSKPAQLQRWGGHLMADLAAGNCKAAAAVLRSFLAIPVGARARLRRCEAHDCARPYFADTSYGGRARFCGDRCRKRGERLRAWALSAIDGVKRKVSTAS